MNIPTKTTMPTRTTMSPQKSNNTLKPFFPLLQVYLNSPTNTIIGVAMALSVGWAFKNLIDTAVSAILEPLLVYLIKILHLNKIPDFNKFLTLQNNTLNICSFIQRLISFILIIAISYSIFNYYYIIKNSVSSQGSM
jgi:large-conductance mechanosensitive channel